MQSSGTERSEKLRHSMGDPCSPANGQAAGHAESRRQTPDKTEQMVSFGSMSYLPRVFFDMRLY
jgi:hypothetical protein